MVNHKEILRLKSLGLTHREIVDAAGCGRNTVTRTLARAREQKLDWQQAQSMSQQEVSQRLFPTEQKNPVYKMPDYEWVHREMQKSGVTLSLLWVEYCEQCVRCITNSKQPIVVPQEIVLPFCFDAKFKAEWSPENQTRHPHILRRSSTST